MIAHHIKPSNDVMNHHSSSNRTHVDFPCLQANGILDIYVIVAKLKNYNYPKINL